MQLKKIITMSDLNHAQNPKWQQNFYFDYSTISRTVSFSEKLYLAMF